MSLKNGIGIGLTDLDSDTNIAAIEGGGGPAPGEDGELDFSNPDQSGLLALLEDI